uniref:Uncharacterized protein n=1 Tax=Vitrella brassicaformis TaxID=1169539 RepID=A0A6U4HFF5_9ALVE|mmetsp:Transcript_48957/g.122682  ORF Transcript_48957/g.122682 Transcript_48957/m.122682 type:complete len:277 (+) Transcript_48957:42-872(+)
MQIEGLWTSVKLKVNAAKAARLVEAFRRLPAYQLFDQDSDPLAIQQDGRVSVLEVWKSPQELSSGRANVRSTFLFMGVDEARTLIVPELIYEELEAGGRGVAVFNTPVIVSIESSATSSDWSILTRFQLHVFNHEGSLKGGKHAEVDFLGKKFGSQQDKQLFLRGQLGEGGNFPPDKEPEDEAPHHMQEADDELFVSIPCATHRNELSSLRRSAAESEWDTESQPMRDYISRVFFYLMDHHESGFEPPQECFHADVLADWFFKPLREILSLDDLEN